MLNPKIIWIFGSAFFLLLIGLVFYLVVSGVSGLSFEFIISNPENAGRAGGIKSIIVSTLLIILITLLLLVPVGSVVALKMHVLIRAGNLKFLGRLLLGSMNVLGGTPSIVFGLLGHFFFCNFLGLGYSIISGALTLFCMCLPFYVKVLFEQITQIPYQQWLESVSLGVSEIRYLLDVVLPQSKSAILLAIILSIGRGFSETAALLFTSGYSPRMPGSILDSGRTISVHIYDLSMNVPGGNNNAYSSVVTLLLIVLFFNCVLKYFFHKGFKNESPI